MNNQEQYLYLSVFQGEMQHVLDAINSFKPVIHETNVFDTVDASIILDYPINRNHIWRTLVWQKKDSSFSVILSNSPDNLYTRMGLLSKLGSVLTLRVSPDIREVLLLKNKEVVRLVRVMKDPRWVFWQQGQPFEFEDALRYSLRPIKDRFTENMVYDFCCNLGYDYKSTDFYKPEGKVIFTLLSPW